MVPYEECIPAFWRKTTFSSLPTFIFWIKATFKCEWSVSIQTVSGPLCLWFFFFRFGPAITIKLVKDTELSTFDSFTTKQGGGGTPYLLYSCLLTNKMLLYLYRSIFIKVFVSFCRCLNWNFERKYKNQIWHSFSVQIENDKIISQKEQICAFYFSLI